MSRRFCKRGHDKQAQHGAYYETSRGYMIVTCAICKRKRNCVAWARGRAGKKSRRSKKWAKKGKSMRYQIVCKICKSSIMIQGSYDSTVNALELNDSDQAWNEVCEHIQAGGDYEIGEEESIEEGD